MKVAVLLLITTLVLNQQFDSGSCSTPAPDVTTPLAELPQDVQGEILSILIHGTVHNIGECTTDPKASQVQYWLHNAKHINGIEFTNFGDLTGNPIKILIHGWGGNVNIPYIKVIRDAYLQRYDADIITVDYSAYANGSYATAYCDLPTVAQNLAMLLCKLDDIYSLSKLHVVGHSLGGQVSGMTGYKVQTQCQKTIGRITGLDPAGPLFQGIATEDRLDSTDAEFVDVIHTNQGQYGYLGNVGDIDFYPNCGFFQPGCLAINRNSTKNDLLGVTLSHVSCAHQRSCYYFAESITQNDFYATADIGPIVCAIDFITKVDEQAYMGEYCTKPEKHPSYFVRTNGEPPYGHGPKGRIQ